MKIAIIACRGDFPIQIAKENPNAFVLCVEDHSSPNFFKNNSEVISLNDPLSWISALKKNKVTHIVMAGKINRISNHVITYIFVALLFILGLFPNMLSSITFYSITNL